MKTIKQQRVVRCPNGKAPNGASIETYCMQQLAEGWWIKTMASCNGDMYIVFEREAATSSVPVKKDPMASHILIRQITS